MKRLRREVKKNRRAAGEVMNLLMFRGSEGMQEVVLYSEVL